MTSISIVGCSNKTKPSPTVEPSATSILEPTNNLPLQVVSPTDEGDEVPYFVEHYDELNEMNYFDFEEKEYSFNKIGAYYPIPPVIFVALKKSQNDLLDKAYTQEDFPEVRCDKGILRMEKGTPSAHASYYDFLNERVCLKLLLGDEATLEEAKEATFKLMKNPLVYFVEPYNGDWQYA